MSNIVNFCMFKWRPEGLNLLPSQINVDYNKISTGHVNKMYNMVKRNLGIDNRIFCITDEPEGLDLRIEIIPIWDDAKEHGGCYKRLKFFSREMKKLIGNRIVQCDFDTIITGDITHLIDRKEPLILYKHHQHLVNGGLWIMDAGIRDDVWTEFNKDQLKAIAAKEKHIGTDQGWLKYYLSHDLKAGKIKTIGRAEGIYDMRTDIINSRQGKLPEDCCMVVFPGARDPSNFTHLDWVKEHWK